MKYHFFLKGWLSQWYRAPMLIGDTVYNCGEQFMMCEKARLFGDNETLDLILKSTSPSKQKALGRQILPFNKEKWEELLPWRDGVKPYCWQRVWVGNYAKFTQNKELGLKLLEIEGILAETNPVDPIWGIGLAEGDPLTLNQETWQGKNWLGEILTDVRDYIKANNALD